MVAKPIDSPFDVVSAAQDKDFEALLVLVADLADASDVLLVVGWEKKVFLWREPGRNSFPVSLPFSPSLDDGSEHFPQEWARPLGVSEDGARIRLPIPGSGKASFSLVVFGKGAISERSRRALEKVALLAARQLSLRQDLLRSERIVETHTVVTDNVPALIAYWDKHQRCRFANKAYFEWFGVLPENLYGMEMRQLLGDSLHKKNLGYILGALRGVPQHFDRDLIRAAVGDLRHTQAAYIPHVVDGEVQGFFVLVTDVTERKRAEMAALQAKEEAVAASRIKSHFLANMSHEIRTPMNGVLGMLSLALDVPSSADQREYLVAASQSAEHLLSIINDILDLSKIEAGQVTLTEDRFSLPEIVHATLAASLIRAEQKGLSVEVRINRGVPDLVRGDSVRLRQVLMNVFSNAVKFTTVGKVGLTVSAEANDMILFTVSDTGNGIPSDQLEVIFQPFRQVDDSNTRSFGGAGLGLAICRSLVEKMGGEIWCESEVGKGSVFYFRVKLPETDSSTKSPISAEPIAAARMALDRKLRVLMAEDDDICARVQELLLRHLNCEVSRAENGWEAVACAKREAFDLILMDVQMPSCDGIEAANRIRNDAESASAKTPIVAVTANAYCDNEAACLDNGMNAFLSKPVRRQDLSEIVRRFRMGLL